MTRHEDEFCANRGRRPFACDICSLRVCLLLLAAIAVATAGLGGASAAEPTAKPAATAKAETAAKPETAAVDLFARENLVAWCIVPFDAKKRGPEARAAMLAGLGFQHYAYDWRAEHLPSLAEEIAALRCHGVELTAVWFPGGLNADAQTILAVLEKHKVRCDLWVSGGGGPAQDAAEQAARVETEAKRIGAIADAAAKIGCRVALYNHGGWYGEPENQLAIVTKLARPNVGIVYNLHHGHDHLARFAKVLPALVPHLYCLNLNGMVDNGEKLGRKILPLGQGDRELALLQAIVDSGYRGRIGILGHTQDDAAARLADNLDGLDWLVPQLAGKPAGPVPHPRTPVAGGAKPTTLPKPPSHTMETTPVDVQVAVAPGAAAGGNIPYDPSLIAQSITASQARGDAKRGASVFTSKQFACISCHKIGSLGGSVGPDLSVIGSCRTPEELVESVFWPKRKVESKYKAVLVITLAGTSHQGYKVREDATSIVLKDAATGKELSLAKDDIDEEAEVGSLMPEGLAIAMSAEQKLDVIRFLTELGKTEGLDAYVAAHANDHVPVTFHFERGPVDPTHYPSWETHVNRARLYDFYIKQANFFRQDGHRVAMTQEFPGLDGGTLGHWGNQAEKTWEDTRWQETDLGPVLAGVFRGGDIVVPKGVCVRIGERGEMATCFNPETLTYDALWEGGFVTFSGVRHGFMSGLLQQGKSLPKPPGEKATQPFVYHGFYRHGPRVIFAYRLGEVEMLDAPWVEDGKFVRSVAPRDTHPLKDLLTGGPAQWPQVFETQGTLGQRGPYAIDNIDLPYENPWKAPLFFGGIDFLSDGTAILCTMQGDVWRVDGIDEKLEHVKWRRIASGIHQAQGLVVADDVIYVLGRDQITKLVDLNRDGEIDFYGCFSNAFVTSPAGHDFICGLERDAEGNFYTASGNQGLLKITPDGKRAEVLATGFRNPDGIGLFRDGSLTVPCSEGDWTPASMICQIRQGGHYGYRGPINNQPPDLPLVYLPRGLDNSSGGQVEITSDRFGPLKGLGVHFSFGACTSFILLREVVDGQPQGAVVPLPGEFTSGVHRGRFSPKDGQLYAVGMAGWGAYTTADGCLSRVRYTGDKVQLPVAFHIHQNGVRVTFSEAVDSSLAGDIKNHFVQTWNYRYGPGYGSPELSTRHFGQRGHDVLEVRSAHVLADRKTIFLEIPELQMANQLHLSMQVDSGAPQNLFATANKLAAPFADFPGYQPVDKVILPHPIHSDLALATKSVPNPWRKRLAEARKIKIEAGKNLTFATRTVTAKAGETIMLAFVNPDVVPHNWVLIKPGSLARVGDLANRLVSDPDAAARNYIPESDDVIVYTDIVSPTADGVIYFKAPKEKGRYPFLCTFPGHWMVMNGEMIVE